MVEWFQCRVVPAKEVRGRGWHVGFLAPVNGHHDEPVVAEVVRDVSKSLIGKDLLRKYVVAFELEVLLVIELEGAVIDDVKH